jgi:hypothetical protein
MKSLASRVFSITFFILCFLPGFSTSTTCRAEDQSILENIQKWTDEQLRTALGKCELGRENEQLLVEIVRRGGDDWKNILTVRHDAIVKILESPVPETTPLKEIARRSGMSNLGLLTALRRLQKKPDPLRIFVVGKREQSFSLKGTSFSVLVINLDDEQQTIHGFRVGGDYRSGRSDKWYFEIHDDKGKLLPTKPPLFSMGGGLGSQTTLEYGESMKVDLPLNSYVDLIGPGKYRFHLFYHNQTNVSDREFRDDLITFASSEICLEVTPLKIRVTDQEREDVKKWIAQLPEEGPVKMAIGIVEYEKFLDPNSPAGKLQKMHTSAVPDLIDAALNKDFKPGQRAWVLGLLFAITECNDPRYPDKSGGNIIGNYESCGAGEESYQNKDSIAPEKQQAFAERWRVWKTDHYYIIEAK